MSRKRGSDLVWGVGELAVQEGSDSWVPPGVTVYLCSICVTKNFFLGPTWRSPGPRRYLTPHSAGVEAERGLSIKVGAPALRRQEPHHGDREEPGGRGEQPR